MKNQNRELFRESENRISENYIPYVYLIKNKKTETKYIGSETGYITKTANPNNLGKTYFTSSKTVKKDFSQNPEYFQWEIIYKCEEDIDNEDKKKKVQEKEREFIIEHDAVNDRTYYNLVISNDKFNGMPGIAKSKECREKIANSLRGKPSGKLGKPHSPEARKKMSDAKKGKPAWNKGKPHSEEHKRKMSKAMRGVKKSEEGRRNMSKARQKYFDNKFLMEVAW